jgi:hypothetical protein
LERVKAFVFLRYLCHVLLKQEIYSNYFQLLMEMDHKIHILLIVLFGVFACLLEAAVADGAGAGICRRKSARFQRLNI